MSKKQRLIYILLILTIIWAYQYTESYFINGENQLIEAFNESDFQLIEGQISVWGLYNRTYMTKESKITCINEIAEAMGLKPNFEFHEREETNYKEVQLVKKSKYAQTVIKMVSMEEVVDENVKEVENYIMIDLTLYQDINSLLYYKNVMETLLKELDMDLHFALNITGEKAGKISEEQKELLAGQMLDYVNARQQEEFISEGIYSIYGYTSLIKDYIMSGDKKINVDVAFTYDEGTGSTRMYLATPIITVLY